MPPPDAQALSTLLGINKRAAKFIYAGLGLLAAIATVLSWGVDFYTAGLMALYFLGLTMLLFTCLYIVRDRILQRTLAWSVTILVILVVCVFFVSAVFPNNGHLPPTYCLVRFWERCPDVAEAIASRTPTPNVSGSIRAAVGVQPEDYLVKIQFAGLISRDSVQQMATALRNNKWKIENAGRGGERTAQAASFHEVRYGNRDDKAAAESLASTVSKFEISAKPLQAVLDPAVPRKTLQVLISR